MHLVIAKVGEVFFDGEAYSITAPGADGEMTVLSEHEPLITTLKLGQIVVRVARDAEPLVFPIESGILEINRAGATVIL